MIKGSVTANWDSQAVLGVKKALARAEIQALSDAAEFILQEGNKMVPHDEGTLERSGDIDISSDEGKKEATVFYDTPYAARLHEHPEYNFQGGRRGKWLEVAIKSNMSTLKSFFDERIKLVFKKGGK